MQARKQASKQARTRAHTHARTHARFLRRASHFHQRLDPRVPTADQLRPSEARAPSRDRAHRQ
eukprot:4001486-Alexandrium_andersonii.AAC.1